jgi:hypothetical protein
VIRLFAKILASNAVKASFVLSISTVQSRYAHYDYVAQRRINPALDIIVLARILAIYGFYFSFCVGANIITIIADIFVRVALESEDTDILIIDNLI